MEARRVHVGAAVPLGSLYAERAADRVLPTALLDNQLSYVLAPRQIGKSSLRLRTQAHLMAAGVRCATVDLNLIGTGTITRDEWYFGIVDRIRSSLELPQDATDDWLEDERSGPIPRLRRFLEEKVLRPSKQRVVVFIDEIDAVLALTFPRDDFFAAIRAMYEDRLTNPIWERLTFCLLGVAAPSELMADPARTPFNIGRRIELVDFTRSEATTYEAGLRDLGAPPGELMDAVYSWTNGHPYMTSKLCAALEKAGPSDVSATARVDELVKETFLRRGRTEDSNLAVAEARIVKQATTRQMLELYGKLLKDKRIIVDRDEPIQTALRLSGIAAETTRDRKVILHVRNRIFREVFDDAWVRAQTVDSLLGNAVTRWVEGGRNDDDVLRGERLTEALEWSRTQQDLTADERNFLLAAQQAAQRQDQQRARTRLLAILVAVVTVLGSIALWQWNDAVKARAARDRSEQITRLKSELASAKIANLKTTAQALGALDRAAAVTALDEYWGARANEIDQSASRLFERGCQEKAVLLHALAAAKRGKWSEDGAQHAGTLTSGLARVLPFTVDGDFKECSPPSDPTMWIGARGNQSILAIRGGHVHEWSASGHSIGELQGRTAAVTSDLFAAARDYVSDDLVTTETSISLYPGPFRSSVNVQTLSINGRCYGNNNIVALSLMGRAGTALLAATCSYVENKPSRLLIWELTTGLPPTATATAELDHGSAGDAPPRINRVAVNSDGTVAVATSDGLFLWKKGDRKKWVKTQLFAGSVTHGVAWRSDAGGTSLCVGLKSVGCYRWDGERLARDPWSSAQSGNGDVAEASDTGVLLVDANFDVPHWGVSAYRGGQPSWLGGTPTAALSQGGGILFSNGFGIHEWQADIAPLGLGDAKAEWFAAQAIMGMTIDEDETRFVPLQGAPREVLGKADSNAWIQGESDPRVKD